MAKKTKPKQQVDDEENLHHPNDKSFKTVMQVKESALEYIEEFAPKFYAHLDLSHFELDTTNYVNKDFDEFYSDVVYQTYLKGSSDLRKTRKNQKRKPIKVVLLFEHKKTVESFFLLLLQVLEYIVLIWRKDVQNKRKPSIIIPIIVYQGPNGLKSRDLHDLFQHIPEELRQYLPNLRLFISNVQEMLDEHLLALEQKGLLRSLLLAYTYTERKDRIKDMLLEIFKFFKVRGESMDFFQLFFEFISKEDYLSAEETEELFGHYLSPYQKKDVMTTYQFWVEKGVVEGKIQGAMKKTRLMVLRGRWQGLTPQILANLSELPYSEVENLMAGYRKVYKFWKTKEGSPHTPIPFLSDDEIEYLMNLFEKNKNGN